MDDRQTYQLCNICHSRFLYGTGYGSGRKADGIYCSLTCFALSSNRYVASLSATLKHIDDEVRMFDWPNGAAGVLASQHISAAIESGIITAGDVSIPLKNVQPASLDLRLGATAYRLRCSYLPDDASVAERLQDYSMGELDLSNGAILERNRPYLVELQESLALPPGMRGKANPKSTTGRLDVFTRLVTDRSFMFDEIEEAYNGPLYLEIVPRTFTIQVRAGDSLNQLRLMIGEARLRDSEILELHDRSPLLFRRGEPVPTDRVAISDGLFLGVDIGHGDDGQVVGFRAKENTGLIDVSERGHYAVAPFWDSVRPDGPGFIVLNPETFYLLMSEDAVCIPPEYAAEMTAYDPTSGELRTHYAGFFDPGFGFREQEAGQNGTRAALEVRAHDVPFAVRQSQKMCRLSFERMLEVPNILYGADAGSTYFKQGLAVGKQFKTPP